jgi:O-antigen/teichoic acid export membrane protein
MSNGIAFCYNRIKTRLLQTSPRVRWSIIDQFLISGANFMTGILLVRILGLQEFGIYSIVIIGLQFVAAIQMAAIIAPMMSMFDQREEVSRSSYLAVIVLHQCIFSVSALILLAVMEVIPERLVGAVMPINFVFAALLFILTQFQDLARRFFYATERPALALLTDSIAYGARFLLIALLAFDGELTLERVWAVIIATSAVAIVVIAPDAVKINFSWSAIETVTRSHKRIAGWMVGNAITKWFSGSFFFLVIGTVLGPAELGAVRAVESLVNVTNLLLQALENFVPSAATKRLVSGGAAALLDYVIYISLIGFAGIIGAVLVVMVFANPIMFLVYGRVFSNQLAILAILGACYALAHVAFVVSAGLRALCLMREAFWSQTIVGFVSVGIAWFVAKQWGAIGALLALLAARILMSGQLSLILRKALRPHFVTVRRPLTS